MVKKKRKDKYATKDIDMVFFQMAFEYCDKTKQKKADRINKNKVYKEKLKDEN